MARKFVAAVKLSIPVFVDRIDNKVNKAYTAMPDRIYVIDSDGGIAHNSGPGPFGFLASLHLVVRKVLSREAPEHLHRIEAVLHENLLADDSEKEEGKDVARTTG